MDAWDEVLEFAGIYFQEHPDEFNESIEWVDDENGYLDEYHHYPMYDINDWLSNANVKTIMQMALNGWDADDGVNFDPDREYFYRDYWSGHLISTDRIDYSDLIDSNAVDALYETYKHYIKRGWTIEEWMLPEPIKRLFDDYITGEVEDD